MKHSLVLLSLLSVTAFAYGTAIPVQKKEVTPTVKKVYQAPMPQADTKQNITVICPTGTCSKPMNTQNMSYSNVLKTEKEDVLQKDTNMVIGVIGQGVAPMNTSSPAQAYALAKRAAVADSYRLIAEKIKGVRIEGDDLIKNMMVKRSTVRTSVKAMVRNANIVETTFKDGLCEVEMEIVISHSDFIR